MMKRIFYSMALALCALMLCLPVKATIFNIATELEWEYLIVYHQAQDGMLMKNGDVIRLQHDLNLNYIEGKDHGSVPENWTLTVDLNGHTLRYDGACSATRTLVECKEGSTLNIKDSGDGGQWIFNDLDGSGQIWLLSMSNNSTVNVYGGALLALYNQNMAFSQKAIHCSKNCTVNVFDGLISTIAGNKSDSSLNNKINLYGGTFGNDFLKNANNVAAIWHDPYLGTIKAGKIYGLEGDAALADYKPAGFPESHLDKALAEDTEVYIDGVLTPQDQLSSDRSTYENSYVEVKYKPNFTAGKTVTSDNANDIMGDGTMRFDIGTNTLYLTNTTGSVKNISSIYWTSFDLTIEVEGQWTCGSIESYGGDLTVRAHHRVQKEEDADMLSVTYTAEEPFAIRGGDIRFENRIKIYAESDQKTDAAFLCHNIYVDDSWLDAWGKPVAQCADAFVTNATIKTGSFKNNDVIQVEPQFTKYYIFVQTNGDERGSVTGEGIYNEGTELTISATPKSGYYFDRWYEDGSTDATRTITVTKDATYTALFFPEEVINYYNVTVLSADETMGTVSGGGTHLEQGQTVTITATPKSGYEFLYWTTSNGQVQGRINEWTATGNETLTAHFRVQPPADAYNLWVCGTQVTGSNSADILGDGVWSYDDATRTLTVMKDATYNITNDGFIEDWAGSGTDEPLIVNVGNHKVEAICTTTDNTLRNAIVGTKGMTFTGTTYHGVTLTAQNMYAANFSSKPLTVTGHMDLTLNLKNTTDWGKDNFKTAVLLAGVTPSLIVDGANLYINSGVGESAGLGYKVTNKTDQAANLSINNASIQWGSISDKSLGILDDSPKYEINYLTPALESLCLTSVFGLSFFEGTHFNLYAYPAPGYKFVSWSDGNTDNPRLIIMPAYNLYLDPIVEVDEPIVPKGAIINANVTEGQGTITNFTSGWYAEGTELTITAVAAEGYTFVQWSDGETANPYLLTVENGKNISITAVFKAVAEGFENLRVEDNQTQKVILNGTLYIIREGRIYNAQGAKMQ